MKKLIMSLAIASLFTLNTYAQDSFSAFKTDTAVTHLSANVSDGVYPVLVHLSDNTLHNVTIADFSNGRAEVNIDIPNDEFSLLMYDFEKKSSYIIEGENISDIPDTPVQDTPNTPPSDNSSELPGVYESERVAIGAFAVVKDVNLTANENDDIMLNISAYYRGREIEFELEEDAIVACKEEGLEQYDGMRADELEEGDIITFNCNLSGKILSIDLLFKAPKTNIITDENYNILFKDTLTKHSCGFGLIADKIKQKEIILYDSTGLEDKAFYFDLDPETVVYYYDFDGRSDKLSIGTIYDIRKSELTSLNFDENDNIISFPDDITYNYAYARIHDNTVCDIVVYANYTE